MSHETHILSVAWRSVLQLSATLSRRVSARDAGRHHAKGFYACGAVLVGIVLLLVTTPAQASPRDAVFEIFDTLNQGVRPVALPQPVHASETLFIFYEQRDFAPAWADNQETWRVLEAIRSSHEDGLQPEDYHYSALQSLTTRLLDTPDTVERDQLEAAFDVLLSDGVLLYARHMIEGKVDPTRVLPTWNFARREFDPARVAQNLDTALAAGAVVETLAAMRPKMRFYTLLREELARYRDLAARYDELILSDGVVYRSGMTHPQVPILREMLARLGFASESGADEQVFDGTLKDAVTRFQRRHSLDADGIVGAATLRELNLPYAERIDRIRLNMDRTRWIQDELTDQLVIVNIAGFELYYIRDTRLAWQTEVMVGTVRTQTPVFRAEVSYLEFNPTWTVPRSIIARSLFARFAANPSHVAERNYVLYDSNGAVVDPSSVNWSEYSGRRFPFTVVQQPGPENAMGRVKFMFPNQYAVYLHDTPSRELFSRTARSFSAGCVRVRNPLEFAERLLSDEQGWTRERIDSVVESGERRVVRLQNPIDIMLMYWTASPDPDSGVQFHPDIYDLDSRSLELLRESPRWADYSS